MMSVMLPTDEIRMRFFPGDNVLSLRPGGDHRVTTTDGIFFLLALRADYDPQQGRILIPWSCSVGIVSNLMNVDSTHIVHRDIQGSERNENIKLGSKALKAKFAPGDECWIVSNNKAVKAQVHGLLVCVTYSDVRGKEKDFVAYPIRYHLERISREDSAERYPLYLHSEVFTEEQADKLAEFRPVKGVTAKQWAYLLGPALKDSEGHRHDAEETMAAVLVKCRKQKGLIVQDIHELLEAYGEGGRIIPGNIPALDRIAQQLGFSLQTGRMIG